MIEQPEKPSLETFSIAFYFKYAEISIYHAWFCSKGLLDSIFVGLKIGVDDPGFLAALRPCNLDNWSRQNTTSCRNPNEEEKQTFKTNTTFLRLLSCHFIYQDFAIKFG